MRKNKILSLRTKYALLVAVTMVGAVLICIVSYAMGQMVIEKVYLSDAKSIQREQAYASEFADYIRVNEIKSNDHEAVKKWCKEKKCVYIMILETNNRFFATDGMSTDFGTLNKEDMSNVKYKANFTDKTKSFALQEFSDTLLYSVLSVFSIVLALAFMFIMFICFMNSLVTRIIRLTDSVKEICSGEAYSVISSNKNDELSQLGQYTEKMRESIVSHYENECRALEANNELITSISHDIRTPLTAIVGYSEIMADGEYNNIDEIKVCAKNCRDKAYQLKDMTDTLFKYFLVYGNASPEVSIDTFCAELFLQQMIGEQKAFLEQKGFVILTDGCEDKIKDNIFLHTDANMLRRVFDNIFSNIDKYADISKPINVGLDFVDNQIVVYFENYISKTKNTAVSTKIGIKTSQKIMDILGGKINFSTAGDKYSVELELPAKEE